MILLLCVTIVLSIWNSLFFFFQCVCQKKGLKVGYICHVLFMNASHTVIFYSSEGYNLILKFNSIWVSWLKLILLKCIFYSRCFIIFFSTWALDGACVLEARCPFCLLFLISGEVGELARGVSGFIFYLFPVHPVSPILEQNRLFATDKD